MFDELLQKNDEIQESINVDINQLWIDIDDGQFFEVVRIFEEVVICWFGVNVEDCSIISKEYFGKNLQYIGKIQ